MAATRLILAALWAAGVLALASQGARAQTVRSASVRGGAAGRPIGRVSLGSGSRGLSLSPVFSRSGLSLPGSQAPSVRKAPELPGGELEVGPGQALGVPVLGETPKAAPVEAAPAPAPVPATADGELEAADLEGVLNGDSRARQVLLQAIQDRPEMLIGVVGMMEQSLARLRAASLPASGGACVEDYTRKGFDSFLAQAELIPSLSGPAREAAARARERLAAVPPPNAATAPTPAPAKGFWSLVPAHFLGVLNDNALKTLVAVWVTGTLAKTSAALFMSLATGALVLPYLLFSVAAGRLSDRVHKGKMVIALKAAEVALAALAVGGLALGNPWILLGLLFLMGTHSAFISPTKYSLLPSMVAPERLTKANGVMEMASFLSLMGGTAAGGLLYWLFPGALPAAGLFFVAVALLGLWPSLGLAKVGAPSQSPAPEASAPKGPPMSRPLYLAAAGLAFFWFVSSMLQMNIFMFAEHVLRSSSAAATALLMALGVATGAGSYVAGLLSEKFEKRGLVLGAVGVALALLDLSLFGGGSLIRAVVDLVILGFSGGFFYIPLNTYLQKGSPEAVRGRNIGIANALGFGAVLLSAGAFWALSSGFGLDPSGVFLVNAGLAAAVAGGLVWKLRKVFQAKVVDFFKV